MVTMRSNQKSYVVHLIFRNYEQVDREIDYIFLPNVKRKTQPLYKLLFRFLFCFYIVLEKNVFPIVITNIMLQ